MTTKRAIDLRPGDMIWYEGEPAEVERVRGRDFVRHAEGTGRPATYWSIKPDFVEVIAKTWNGVAWESEFIGLGGDVELCPCKHVVIPAGKYLVRNAETGAEYEAELLYTVGYQWEVTL